MLPLEEHPSRGGPGEPASELLPAAGQHLARMAFGNATWLRRTLLRAARPDGSAATLAVTTKRECGFGSAKSANRNCRTDTSRTDASSYRIDAVGILRVRRAPPDLPTAMLATVRSAVGPHSQKNGRARLRSLLNVAIVNEIADLLIRC